MPNWVYFLCYDEGHIGVDTRDQQSLVVEYESTYDGGCFYHDGDGDGKCPESSNPSFIERVFDEHLEPGEYIELKVS